VFEWTEDYQKRISYLYYGKGLVGQVRCMNGKWEVFSGSTHITTLSSKWEAQDELVRRVSQGKMNEHTDQRRNHEAPPDRSKAGDYRPKYN